MNVVAYKHRSEARPKTLGAEYTHVVIAVATLDRESDFMSSTQLAQVPMPVIRVVAASNQ